MLPSACDKQPCVISLIAYFPCGFTLGTNCLNVQCVDGNSTSSIAQCLS